MLHDIDGLVTAGKDTVRWEKILEMVLYVAVGLVKLACGLGIEARFLTMACSGLSNRVRGWNSAAATCRRRGCCSSVFLFNNSETWVIE